MADDDDAQEAGESDPSAADDSGSDTDGSESDTVGGADDRIGLIEARRTALEAVETLLEHPLDGVVRVGDRETAPGWRVLVEVVERSAIPDTQDILGRYEILLDETGRLDEYGLVERYKRGENKEEL